MIGNIGQICKKHNKIRTNMSQDLIDAFQRECYSHWNEQTNDSDSSLLKDNYRFY